MDNASIVVLIKTSKAKKLVTDKKLTDDDILNAVLEVQQTIMNYCSVPEVPAALSYTVANMATDLLLYTAEKNATPEVEVDASTVDTLNIGDTTLKFANDTMKNSERQRALNSHSSRLLDDIVMNYRQQLNQFRRLY